MSRSITLLGSLLILLYLGGYSDARVRTDRSGSSRTDTSRNIVDSNDTVGQAPRPEALIQPVYTSPGVDVQVWDEYNMIDDDLVKREAIAAKSKHDTQAIAGAVGGGLFMLVLLGMVLSQTLRSKGLPHTVDNKGLPGLT